MTDKEREGGRYVTIFGLLGGSESSERGISVITRLRPPSLPMNIKQENKVRGGNLYKRKQESKKKKKDCFSWSLSWPCFLSFFFVNTFLSKPWFLFFTFLFSFINSHLRFHTLKG